MTSIYFISEKTLRANSLINDNVESTFINQAILTAQTINLQEVIGTALFTSLQDQIKAGTFKDDKYKTLIEDYITPYLINRVMADIVIPIHYKIRNAGILTNNDQHFQTASLNDVEYVKNYYENNATFSANRMIEYLLNNKETFTELKDDEHWIKMSQNTTKTPIYFRK